MIRSFLLACVIYACLFPSPTQAQGTLSVESGMGIVGSGDHLIPSGQVTYAREIFSHVDATTRLRFSHIQTYGSEWLLQRANLTYLDGSVGLTVHPLDSDHHRIDLGLSATLRGRWERRATRARIRPGPDGRRETRVWYERRSSADVGYLLRAGYNYRIAESFWMGFHMHGYTYQEGTPLFLFGLSLDYEL